MRDETRRKLNEAVRWEKARGRFGLILGFVLLSLVAYLVARNVPVSERLVPGVVQQSFWKMEEDTGRRYAVLQVHLDDGQLVRASTFQSGLPGAGSNIVLRETTWASGFHSYNWEGPAEQAGKP